jgi:hypothetical protein
MCKNLLAYDICKFVGKKSQDKKGSLIQFTCISIRSNWLHNMVFFPRSIILYQKEGKQFCYQVPAARQGISYIAQIVISNRAYQTSPKMKQNRFCFSAVRKM